MLIAMTIWSIPLTGIRGKRPWDEDWKSSYRHDTRLIIEGECLPLIPIPNFDGLSLQHYEYHGEDLEPKFSGKHDFEFLKPHLSKTYCEIVIDDSFWKPPFMPMYPFHDEVLKLQTVMAASGSLITALRLIGFNRFIAPCILKNSTLQKANDCKEGTIHFYPHHPFHMPLPMLEESKARLSKKDFLWVSKATITLHQLFFTHDFSPTMTALSYYYHDMPQRAKMTLIWAAIEDLLKPKRTKEHGIRFGLRSRGAMMLGRNDEEISKLFEQIGNLYGKRNDATHGRQFTYNKGIIPTPDNTKLKTDMLALRSSYQLLCEILIRIIDRGTLFTDSELLELEDGYKDKFPE